MKKLIILLMAAMAVFTSCERDPYTGQTTSKVVSHFSYTKSHPHYVEFVNNSVNAVSYKWDFGDGNTSTYKNVIYQYRTKGVYKVTLTAYDSKGGSDVSEATITIEDPTKCYISGITYNKVEYPNKYYKVAIKDNDRLFVNTWLTTAYTMLSPANLPYYYNIKNPVADPKEESDYYYVYVYWADNTTASGEQVMKQQMYVSDIYKYPESITLTNNSKNTQVVVHFLWK